MLTNTTIATALFLCVEVGGEAVKRLIACIITFAFAETITNNMSVSYQSI